MNLASIELSVWALVFLGNVAVASLVVCGAALVMRRLLGDGRLPLQHALLVCALAAVLASPLIVVLMGACGVSLIHIPISTGAPKSAMFADVLLPLAQRSATLPPSELAPEKAVDTGANSAPIVTPVLVNPPSQQPTARIDWSWSLAGVATALVIVWAMGTAIQLGLLAAGLLATQRLLWRVRAAGDARVALAATEAARELGLAHVPAVYESEWAKAPVSAGLWRPRVIVPAGMLAALSADRLRGLMMHELAHVARGDHYIGLLQRLVVAAYWWNPLVWRVSALTAVLREQICDDLATGRDETADDYAAMLVELAGRVVRARPLPATIGMFEGSRREFHRRVERLLDHERPITTRLDRRMKLIAAACAAALVLLPGVTTIRIESASAAEETAPAATEAVASDDAAAVAPSVKWPQVLRGTIKDEAGQPIDGARVQLKLEKIHEYSIGRWDETLSSQEMTTGANGEYRFDTAAFPVMEHRPFMLMMSVTADGYADTKTWNWYARRVPEVKEQWANLTLWPGRVVRGRVVDQTGRPVPGAVIKAVGDFGMNQFGRNQAWNPRKTDEDGNFSLSVPSQREGAIELWIVSRDWAPQRVAVPKQGNELADVRLQPGGRITGRVTREDGSPVAGTVVVAESVDNGTFPSIAFGVQLAAKTDTQGRYKLPPIAGIYKIYLSQASETDERLTNNFVLGDVPPPLVSPVKVAVSGHQEEVVDFHAGPTLTVRGNVRWPDGSPVADCQVQASFMPPGFGTGIWVDDTRTDAQGNYTIELPKPIDAISICVTGAFDENREWHFAEPAEGVEAEQTSLQFIRLGRLTEDREGMDWVLKSREEIDDLQPVESKPKDAAVLELEKLERRYAARQQEFQDAMDATTSREDEFKLFTTQDPRILMADDYLAFEAQHEGTDVGLAALAKVEQFAASVSDRMPKLPEARRDAYERLTTHYLSNPGLDTVFSSVSAGPRTELGPELLRKAAAESPHRNVQAAAIYWLSRYLQNEADSIGLLNTTLAELEHQTPRNQAYIDLIKAQLETRKNCDTVELHREAVKLARRLERDYADVRQPLRMFQESGIYSLATKEQSAGMDSKPTYGQLANGLLFDLERLQLGLPAPAIDSTDRDGRHVDMHDYTGNVTVIAFVAFGHEPIEAQLADVARLPDGERLQTVVIQCDSGLIPANDRDEPAPARFIDERPNGPVATQWAVSTWPTIFVVDGNGIIRARRLPQLPTYLVSELLKGAAAGTQ